MYIHVCTCIHSTHTIYVSFRSVGLFFWAVGLFCSGVGVLFDFVATFFRVFASCIWSIHVYLSVCLSLCLSVCLSVCPLPATVLRWYCSLYTKAHPINCAQTHAGLMPTDSKHKGNTCILTLILAALTCVPPSACLPLTPHALQEALQTACRRDLPTRATCSSKWSASALPVLYFLKTFKAILCFFSFS